MEFPSPLDDVPIDDSLPFHQFILQDVASRGSKAAFIDAPTGRRWNYDQLSANVTKAASALSRLGLTPRDPVLFFSANNIDYPILYLAVISAGGIATTCNPLYKSDELLHQMNDVKPVMVVTEAAFLDTVKTASESYGNIKTTIVFDKPCEGCVTFADMLADDGGAAPRVDFKVKEDVAIVPYSSGTTGRPKGVVHTHYTMVAGLSVLAHPMISPHPDPEDVALCVTPMYHILAQGIYLALAVNSGITVVVLPRFTPAGFLQAIQDYKVTSMTLVPPIAVFLAKHPLVDQYDLSSLRSLVSAAAPLGREIIDTVKTRLNLRAFRQLYGMTECLATHVMSAVSAVPGCVGTTAPNNRTKVIDLDTGHTIARPFADGEVCVKGPQIMLGYLNRPDATRATIDEDGWLHTGDIGHHDEDGNLFIVDRLKELIKYNAYQVPPAELENLLLQHAAVADAAVVGVPNLAVGELPKAFVVLKAGVSVTEQELVDYVTERVAPQKKLRGGVEFIDQIPKSPSGKILRRLLKERVRSEQAKGSVEG